MPHRYTRRTVAMAASAAAITAILPAAARQEPPAIPDSPAGTQLQWVLDLVNGVVPMPGEAGLAEHFSALFLAAMSSEELLANLAAVVAALTPLTLIEIVSFTPTDLVAIATAGDGTAVRIVVVVEANAPYLIDGLLFQPADADEIAPTSIRAWADLDSALIPLASRVGISVAEFAADGIRPIHDLAADDVFPLGSVFKLYVLGAVALAVRDGTLAWDTPVVIDPARKSLPSGITQDEPDGTDLPVSELVSRMIALSDNTATDLLIHLVGRDAVEAMLAPMGNSVPERNLPFLTTRELFVLKLGDAALRDRYLAATTEERCLMLGDEVAAAPLPAMTDLLEWVDPIAIDTLEWFATPHDITRAHAAVLTMIDDPTLTGLSTLLAVDGGLAIDHAPWPLVAFKGGSEPGVLVLTVLLERIDGRRFSVAICTEHATGDMPASDITGNVLGALILLEAHR